MTDRLVVPATAADLLDAMYALTRHWRKTLLDPSTYDDMCRASDDGRVVGGLTHLRNWGVHDAVVLSDFTDRVGKYFYDHYGCWVWQANAGTGNDELSTMYHHAVADREVRLSLKGVRRFLFEALPARLSH